jgi:hypothetical protein
MARRIEVNNSEGENISRARMKRWRNVLCPESQPDAEIKAIDAVEDELEMLPPLVERIRALISRIDPLSHYKAFENVEFILEAIGHLDYPGSPAVDVLWRHGQIDEQRRETAKQYISALNLWLQRLNIKQALESQPENADMTNQVYNALGEFDAYKRWLAMSLQKTLKEHAFAPWDFINECDDKTFVQSTYLAILHRPPSSDDLQFRLEELQEGKSRKQFLDEILDAAEHKMSHLYGLAEMIKSGR